MAIGRGWSVVAGLAVAAAVAIACGGDGGDAAPASRSPTAAAEVTASDPTPTAEPSPAAPAGWRSFEQEAFSIALPPAYTGGVPSDPQVIDALRALGGDCAAAADAIAALAGTLAFSALDSRTCNGSSVRTIAVIAGPLPGETPAEFIEAFVPGLPATSTLLAQREGTIGGAPAAILQIQRSLGALTTVQDIYAVRGTDGWAMLSLATATADYDAARAEFDAIAQTFRSK